MCAFRIPTDRAYFDNAGLSRSVLIGGAEILARPHGFGNEGGASSCSCR